MSLKNVLSGFLKKNSRFRDFRSKMAKFQLYSIIFEEVDSILVIFRYRDFKPRDPRAELKTDKKLKFFKHSHVVHRWKRNSNTNK